MEWLIPGAVGALIGWGIGMVFDWAFWRNRRICGEMEAELQATVGRLEQQNTTLHSEIGRIQTQTDRIPKLESDLDARTAQYNGLLADVETRKRREASLNANVQARDNEVRAAKALRTRVQELEQNLSTRDAELARIRSDYEGRGAQVSGLGGKVEDLQSQLQSRDREIKKLLAEIAGKDSKLSELAAAASGVAAGGLLAGRGSDDQLEVSGLQADLDARNAELATVKEQLEASNGEVAQLRGALDEKSAELANTQLNTTISASEVETPITETSIATAIDDDAANDLGMIWGINDEVNRSLEADGIRGYSQLAASAPEQVDGALTAATRFYPGMDKRAIHSSWVEQATHANAGEWDQLSAYQSGNLDVGSGRDDLKLIWGIGPKIEGVMNDNGIYTFAQIAAVPAERLSDILHKAGSRFRMSSDELHKTWPTQARLADQGKMDELTQLQSGLSKK